MIIKKNCETMLSWKFVDIRMKIQCFINFQIFMYTILFPGKTKVNNIPVVSQNIPATNGVIHALEALL